MQSILDHASVRIAGALSLARHDTGVVPRRLPKWAADQIVDPGFRFVMSSASGLRITFTTDADAIELDVMLTGTDYPGNKTPPPCFDLVVDGELRAGHVTRSGGLWVVPPLNSGRTDPEFVPGDPETISFAGLGGTRKRIEIWLPQNRRVELRGLRVPDGAGVERAEPAPVRWVHYGSSISQCSEADRPTHVWPVVAARTAGVELTSLGFGGQCQLDQCVARTIRDLPVDVISAKVGVNIINADSLRERTFVPALHGFLDTVRDGHPDTPLLLVTPIIFPASEQHPGPTAFVGNAAGVFPRPPELAFGALSIGRIRELSALVVAQRQKAGDANLHLLDGRELFGPDDVADLPDGLHPNTAGYIRMGERFAKLAFADGGPFAGPALAAAGRA
jgi:hypothetical protein